MLNISRQIYAGWHTTPVSLDELPEAEVIPLGGTTNEKKKIERITSKYNIVKEFDNIPLPGFTLHKTNRARYGSLDPTWLIIDPRGFLARISQENLEKILHVTGITEGLIQEQCVWARENSNTKMMLVPVSSPSYIEAVKNTELIEGKVNRTDIQIGDEVLLQNGLTGTYLGIVSLYGGLQHPNSRDSELKARSHLRRQVIQTEPDKFHFQINVKILKVLKKTSNPLTKEQSVEIMNESIARGSSYFTSSSNMNAAHYFSGDIIRFVSVHAAQSVKLLIDEISKEEAQGLFYASQAISDTGMLVLEKAMGDRFLIDHPWPFYSGPKNTINSFNISEISSNDYPPDRLVLKDKQNHYYSMPTGQTYSLDFFKKFYKIVKHVKNDTYI